MIILKLGGSVVTDKSVPFSVREAVVRRLAHEIKETNLDVIVVHGGGSFGHPVASKYGLQNGLSENGQLIGVAKTRLAMEDLNRRIVDIFVSSDLPAVSIQTSAVFKCENKRISTSYIDTARDFLKLGIVPLLYGDVVVDTALGVCILSGDQIVAYLARKMGAEKVVFATNVDGILDRKGRVIEKINNENASAIEFTGASDVDVTGQMKGKVEELLKLTEAGVSAIVVNALESETVKNALLGKSVKGTLFEV
jgi:isopentenyl phosphate kinase